MLLVVLKCPRRAPASVTARLSPKAHRPANDQPWTPAPDQPKTPIFGLLQVVQASANAESRLASEPTR